MLASCAEAVVEPVEPVEPVVPILPVEPYEPIVPVEPVEPVVVPGVPQYGGTLTFLMATAADEGKPGAHEGDWWGGCVHSGPIFERLTRGDIEKYGERPGGTGDFAFKIGVGIPLQWRTGEVAESWDVTADEIVFHIRRGVYFVPNLINPDMMERREITAHDVVWNLQRMLEKGQGGLGDADIVETPYEETIYAEDDFTVVVEMKGFDPEWIWKFEAFWGQYQPPEMVEAGPNEWENVVGTGPFILKEVAAGSHIIYAPNPYYWRKTTIDGVEYDIPFVGELVTPFIPDRAVQVSALRTALLDFVWWVNPEYGPSLDATNPELQSSVVGGTWPVFVSLRTDTPPLDDVNVRRALMIGLDREAVLSTVYLGVGATYVWPLVPGVAGHVPLEDLPPSTRLLFDFNPTLAKQMLAEAGYPDGFKMEIATESYFAPVTEMVAGLWTDDLGLEVEMIIHEDVAFEAVREQKLHKDAILTDGSAGLEIESLKILYTTGGSRNYGNYSNPDYDALFDLMAIETDAAKRAAMGEELFVMALDDCSAIGIVSADQYHYWWPWLKNYYGESADDPWEWIPELIWIDQALKVEMGY